ncbi:ammonium transporter Rh type A-like [Saccostrea echinata]|uniref:ammonium transporter Rh type A-like n=1 Tax=Saccostrea echinata TaxID=191078 RepID=UPI002A7FE962|nr:ammonium transporter Rh type A-like [Saccostrea echinata]
MVEKQSLRLIISLAVVQIVFLVIFGVKIEYHETAKPLDTVSPSPVGNVYPMFQDVHVMIYIGFGFLMTFLKRYGYSSVSFNLLLAAFSAQWAIIIRSAISGNWQVGVMEMLTADFAAATILISFGAVLGKTGPLQLLIMATIEVVLAQVNEHIGYHILHTADVGESMFIHAFGAYFGLAVARVLYNEDVEKSTKEGATYHSDLFSMIGTVFLWLYWPSFNGGAVEGDQQHRAVINTYLSLLACTVTTFIISSLVDKRGKFEMVHIQNATLAGGVAVGTSAHMPIQPWGAMLLGTVAGVISTLGYKYLTPALSSKLKIHDTCGVNNLHGMPGILAAIGGAVAAALSSKDTWGDSLYSIFTAMEPTMKNTTIGTNTTMVMTGGRSAIEQGGYQMAALCVTLIIAIVGGVITGFILRIPFLDSPKAEQLFDDQNQWNVAEEGFPGSGDLPLNGKPNDDTKIPML